MCPAHPLVGAFLGGEIQWPNVEAGKLHSVRVQIEIKKHPPPIPIGHECMFVGNPEEGIDCGQAEQRGPLTVIQLVGPRVEYGSSVSVLYNSTDNPFWDSEVLDE
jgi:hypothetical protein